jgi:S1-C subfamily serine protease
MMEATVKLQGRNSLGTAFMLMRAFQVQKGPKGMVSGKAVLVTAAHVLEGIPEDEITVTMHSLGPSGDWVRHESRLQIRRNGRPLWKQNPDADVAVMYVDPDISPFRKAPTLDLLATDEILQRYSMTPGMNLKCLGFPLGKEGNAAGFAILRTGDIASYPLLPTVRTKTFLMDFRVFKGNSGGPVYFSQPQVRGGITFGGRAQFIMGLVSQEAVFPIRSEGPYEASVRELQLMLGVVVHASIVRQTIELLPPPESPESESMVVKMYASR